MVRPKRIHLFRRIAGGVARHVGASSSASALKADILQRIHQRCLLAHRVISLLRSNRVDLGGGHQHRCVTPPGLVALCIGTRCVRAPPAEAAFGEKDSMFSSGISVEEVESGPFGRRAMSDLSPLCAAKRTLISRSDHAAAARSSLSAPRATTLSASSGNGRCNALASSHGARIQTKVAAVPSCCSPGFDPG